MYIIYIYILYIFNRYNKIKIIKMCNIRILKKNNNNFIISKKKHKISKIIGNIFFIKTYRVCFYKKNVLYKHILKGDKFSTKIFKYIETIIKDEKLIKYHRK